MTAGERDTAPQIRAERKHADASAKRADELAASHDGLAAAAEGAQAALLALVDAVRDHNGLVHQHAGEMAAQGLTPILDGHASSSPRDGVVHLRGEWWRPYDLGEVLRRLHERVYCTRVEPRNRHLIHRTGATNAQVAASALLAKIPVPSPEPSALLNPRKENRP
ncbi:hypothetical protein [Saccharothrix lopnurensis]|uniref:Uncharacterized protein n=1 Tax=Saccharothrix lopnurensis TaxID=1670621 RepID=A0ABW1P5J7_9PSEU